MGGGCEGEATESKDTEAEVREGELPSTDYTHWGGGKRPPVCTERRREALGGVGEGGRQSGER